MGIWAWIKVGENVYQHASGVLVKRIYAGGAPVNTFGTGGRLRVDYEADPRGLVYDLPRIEGMLSTSSRVRA